MTVNLSSSNKQIDTILVLDFGSQYTQLIARRVRESNVYSEILPWDIDEEKIRLINPKGIILWHDYVPGKESAKDVVKYIHEISKKKKINHLKHSSLCFYKNND